MKQYTEYPSLFIVDHPLVQHKLSHMRDKNTTIRDFRDLLKEIAVLIGYEATKNFPLASRKIDTPICTIENAPVLAGEPPVIVPILRAGLFMADGLLSILPNASIGHVGMYRDHETKKPIEYFVKLPEVKKQTFILVDPMFATGFSACAAVEALKKRGVKTEDIIFVALVGSMNAVKVFTSAYPDIPVYIAAIDEYLNEDAYIVPGLGDAGDRLFGTL